MDKPKVTAVIPALNEENTVSNVVKEVKKYVDEVILINDASKDSTAALAEKEGAILLSHSSTKGYDKSLNDGFALAEERNATIVVTFDADGQHNPGDIPMMIKPIMEGNADIVVGERPHYARFTEHFYGLVSKVKAGVRDPLCGLKAYDIKVYRDIGYFDRVSSIGTHLMFKASKKGYRIIQKQIKVNHRKDTSRFGGRLKANWKILVAALKIALGR